jgi:hypothetical protein
MTTIKGTRNTSTVQILKAEAGVLEESDDDRYQKQRALARAPRAKTIETYQGKYSMADFVKGKPYLFRNRQRRGSQMITKERKFMFLESAPAAIKGGLKLFKSTTAPWKESFTPAQLGDYEIEVAK